MTLPYQPFQNPVTANPSLDPTRQGQDTESKLSGPPTDRAEEQLSRKDAATSQTTFPLAEVPAALNALEKGLLSPRPIDKSLAIDSMGPLTTLLDAQLASMNLTDEQRRILESFRNRLASLQAQFVASGEVPDAGGGSGRDVSLQVPQGGSSLFHPHGSSGTTLITPEVKVRPGVSLAEHVARETTAGGMSLGAASARQKEEAAKSAEFRRQQLHEAIVDLKNELRALDMADGKASRSLAEILNSICETYPPSASALKAQVEEINKRQAAQEQA